MAENWKTGEFAGKVIDVADLTELLAVFGMMAGTDPLADRDYVRLQMSHALLGVVEAHATRAEDAYRTAQADTDPRELSADLTQASLMTFAGANCQSPVDELAVIMWRATRLAGAIGVLFAEETRHPAKGGSNDNVLLRAIGLVAAALSGMATAAATAANPNRPAGESAVAGQALIKAALALQEAAKEIDTLRAAGELMTMTN